MAQYSPLPSYTDDVKMPLLAAHDDHEDGMVNVNLQAAAPQEPACGRRRCGGFMGRLRARCEARRLEKFGPPCDNPRCMKRDRKRRAFRCVIFTLFSLFMLVHLFKGAYMLYSLPNRINCVPVTSTTSTYELPLSKKLLVDYSLTTGTTTLTHADTNTTTVKLSLADVSEDEEILFCTGTFKRGVGFGLYTKDKHTKLPKVVETVITLPQESGPVVKFVGKKAGHCAQKIVRKVLKWKKAHGGEEEEDED
ncbi:hypothetical protein M408DRAFT_328289 [Serendipita vermifera MAFF 305830]|uniref:Uncharacterized protein n=1 Tax=Serendipita vermifera MAFF 305830 TaxID=933852 RepID=A0A0C2XMP7_SERVB|nr:hypothetical protein M408DRAFT_328289 [Serendipita vermifera MAFF 305830]